MKSKPLKTSFHLFGETTSGSLNAPSARGKGQFIIILYLIDEGLILPSEPRDNADVFGVMKVQTGQKWKTTSDCRFPFSWWSLVLAQHELNKDDTVSNSGTALTPKVIVFSFLTRAPNLSLSPWESGNKWQLFPLSLWRLDFLPGHWEKGSSVFLNAK